MISRGKLFYTGVILFLAGFIIPFIIGLVIGFIGVEPNDRYNMLFYVFATGTFAALGIGVPMIVIAIVMGSRRRSEQRRE